MLEEYFNVRFKRPDGDNGPPLEVRSTVVAAVKAKLTLISIRRPLNRHRDSLPAKLVGLPELLTGYVPCAEQLPLFLLRLATEVNWTDEQDCFEGVCVQLAYLFSVPPPSKNDGAASSGSTDTTVVAHSATVLRDWWHAFRHLLIPPREFSRNMTVIHLASLEKLYRVFERC